MIAYGLWLPGTQPFVYRADRFVSIYVYIYVYICVSIYVSPVDHLQILYYRYEMLCKGRIPQISPAIICARAHAKHIIQMDPTRKN